MAIVEGILTELFGCAVESAGRAYRDNIEKRDEAQAARIANLARALQETKPIAGEIRRTMVGLAKQMHLVGISGEQHRFWKLLSDEAFQTMFIEWLGATSADEATQAGASVLKQLQTAAEFTDDEKRTALVQSHLEQLDRAMASNPVVMAWRHQLGLDFVRGQVVELRRLAEEAAGIFSPARQRDAIDKYCKKSLKEWDIIDLSNLPETDVKLATQKLLLRQLYMPIRLNIERSDPADSAARETEIDADLFLRNGEVVALESENYERRVRPGGRISVASQLKRSPRLVILGDPGGGKTTLLRWLATAYLLRYRNEQKAFKELPDTKSLPRESWIPVMIRCRDLGHADLCRSFSEFLQQQLRKTELHPQDADVVCAVILKKLATGDALLLVDGLDEISDVRVRVLFCQELERTAARYPAARIVVTSRIVGYRDMPFHLGKDFEHGVVAALGRGEKEKFAERWIEVVDHHRPAAERETRIKELVAALRSSDRVERLTDNPMLLTTLVLVKRKVGKLPNRRTKLYSEAVAVLLNWNSSLYEVIDEFEAVPQLEYLAYEMCLRGVKRLGQDDVLDLFDRVRTEYPNVRPIRRRSSSEFLSLLEARSSILIRAGSQWLHQSGKEHHVWEFRHLTFQEYLAARALIDGRFPGRDRTLSLADRVRPLAEFMEERQRPGSRSEQEIAENWREAIRLVVADCQDDDVDEVIGTICNLENTADAARRRARVGLAASCLIDEPNIGEATADKVIRHFGEHVERPDGSGRSRTSYDDIAVHLAKGIWAEKLITELVAQFRKAAGSGRVSLGGLAAMVLRESASASGLSPEVCVDRAIALLRVAEPEARTRGALWLMDVAYSSSPANLFEAIDPLLRCDERDPAQCTASAWALGWIGTGNRVVAWSQPRWAPMPQQLQRIFELLDKVDSDDALSQRWLLRLVGYAEGEESYNRIVTRLERHEEEYTGILIEALGYQKRSSAIPILASFLRDEAFLDAAVQALERISAKEVLPLLHEELNRVSGGLSRRRIADAIVNVETALGVSIDSLLKSAVAEVRKRAVERLSRGLPELERKLASSDSDGIDPWRDPAVPIPWAEVQKASAKLRLAADDVASAFRIASSTCGFKLEF